MFKPVLLLASCGMLLIGCSTQPTQPYPVSSSYLIGDPSPEQTSDKVPDRATDSKPMIQYSRVPSFQVNRNNQGEALDLTKRFSASETVALSADSLPLNQFLHYVLGESLGVNYILGQEAKNDSNGITLNIKDPVSKRKLYSLVEDVLSQAGYQIIFKDDIFYVSKAQQGTGNIVVGYGNKINDVPNSSVEIKQFVPLNYPVKSGVNSTIQGLAKVNVQVDYDQNALVITGRRSEVIKALEFVQLVDAPAFQNRKVAIYRSRFVPADELGNNLIAAMANEGIAVATDKPRGQAVSILPIERISSILLFANTDELMNRTHFWLKELDQASMVEEMQYFTYIPQFARASDIVESLTPLISGTTSSSSKSGEAAPTTAAKTVGKPNAKASASNDKINVVVDQRSNSLIVQSTGIEYERLLPLIKRLDVMPKQVMLEVMIAEVTLTDEFAQGIEFALSSGDWSLSTKGTFGVEKIGGLGFGIKGIDGELVANFFQSNSHVNVLSRPSVVVRDGVSADMSVGTDIPVVGETSSDPDGDRQTTSIQYRKTGVQLTVTPTVNSQGVVIMEISQSNSNQAQSSSTVANSPAIFERSIRTEVVAQSGQAVILGGLISENTSLVESKVPFLGDLPLIGGLFRANNDESTKTELVVMVTPRIIESSDEWDDVKSSFINQMTQLEFAY